MGAWPRSLFHSVLGVRPGILGAARWLTEVAQESVGYPELPARAGRATAGLRDGFVVGFSLGVAPAEYVACTRPVTRVLLFGGALPLVALHQVFWKRAVGFCAGG